MKRLLFSAFVLISFTQVNAQQIAIKNISIITMNDSSTSRNKTILLKNGKFYKMLISEKNIPNHYQKIDGTGKLMIPGLFDMHTHLLYEQRYPCPKRKTNVGERGYHDTIMNGGEVHKPF